MFRTQIMSSQWYLDDHYLVRRDKKLEEFLRIDLKHVNGVRCRREFSISNFWWIFISAEAESGPETSRFFWWSLANPKCMLHRIGPLRQSEKDLLLTTIKNQSNI